MRTITIEMDVLIEMNSTAPEQSRFGGVQIFEGRNVRRKDRLGLASIACGLLFSIRSSSHGLKKFGFVCVIRLFVVRCRKGYLPVIQFQIHRHISLSVSSGLTTTADPPRTQTLYFIIHKNPKRDVNVEIQNLKIFRLRDRSRILYIWRVEIFNFQIHKNVGGSSPSRVR